jgi:D-tagatose-1,6-bisphosphate aldolase subunit GatZ/KbaZ
MSHLLDAILRAQKRGEAAGIPSICSAHPWVLKTALQGEDPVLIESTCNQVNQFGGYSGMTPTIFVEFVRRRAAENGFQVEKLILGGDHLGPSPWQERPVDASMPRACGMVRDYAMAGFTKLHLDASMKLGDDDPTRPLDLELAAQRSAQLATVAESCVDMKSPPCYVIGSEVPIPGGAVTNEADLHVTTVEDAQRTLEVTKAAFLEAGLESAWERVIGMVVQPGVEFGDDFIVDYDPEAGGSLAQFIETTPYIYEAHSTDYQKRESLQRLVRDHFAILKVGPALTNAFREAVYALAAIESELIEEEERSRLIEKLESVMLKERGHWLKHYQGNEQEKKQKRKFSFSDRVRYYWPDPEVQTALQKLFHNLNIEHIPLSLVSQFLPEQYEAIRNEGLLNSASSMVTHRITNVLNDYFYACGSYGS